MLVTKASEDREPPARTEPSLPEEPQTSLPGQTIGPDVTRTERPTEPVERTLEEESLRRRQGD